MRKTKIICTLGPACKNEDTLTKMCLAGMNVARLNFSHGTHEQHKEMIELVKKVRDKLEMPIAIMLDTKGPEYRIKTFKDGKILLNDGDSFTFTTEDIVGDETKVGVNYKGLITDLCKGDKILVNNGLVSFEVKELLES
ncbi:MAG: pyruvate kinase, partial [Clostridia bacterium]|nr:pyruvate kinase [Clostridia bacterium]